MSTLTYPDSQQRVEGNFVHENATKDHLYMFLYPLHNQMEPSSIAEFVQISKYSSPMTKLTEAYM